MIRKIALATVFGLAGMSLAMAQGGSGRQGMMGGGMQRPGMQRQGMNQNGGQGQNQQNGQGMQQGQMGGRGMMMEERAEEVCKRGEEAVANLKERKAPEELVSLVERHQKERCEMVTRHAEERKALMEKLKAEREKNGNANSSETGGDMMPPPMEDGNMQQ